MKQKRQRFPIRLPVSLVNDLDQFLESHPQFPSRNSFITALLDQFFHPDKFPSEIKDELTPLRVYLGKIDKKLSTLREKRETISTDDFLLRKKASQIITQIGDEKHQIDLQQQILELLQIESLSELRLAKETNQAPETVFVVLSFLEQKNQVRFNEQKQYWELVSHG